MRQIGMLVVLAAALALAGCQKKAAQPEVRMEEPARPLDQMDTAGAPAPLEEPALTPPAGRPLSPPPGPAASPRGRPVDEELTPGGPSGRTYVVQRGDTLYGIARKFYGDGSQWKRIWEANRTRVPNRDKLAVGTKLIIP